MRNTGSVKGSEVPQVYLGPPSVLLPEVTRYAPQKPGRRSSALNSIRVRANGRYPFETARALLLVDTGPGLGAGDWCTQRLRERIFPGRPLTGKGAG